MAGEPQELETDDDFGNLSDEEFLSQHPMPADPVPAQASPDPEEAPAPKSNVLEDRLGLPAGVTEALAADPDEEDEQDDAAFLEESKPAPVAAKPAEAPAPAATTPAPNQTTPNQAEAATAPAVAPVAEAPNYEDLYKQIMAPFKANGKEVAPSNPEEAIRLMQMGANYTKKMQVLQPNLKLMKMLENNGLLEESKLSFLIDLDKKDPKAIQKLLHDGKIDPLDLDPSTEPAYVPGNHRISDQEMQFHDVLSEVALSETGQETIIAVNKWDQASKQAVYKEPVLLSLINEQRNNGIFDRISAEIDRRQTLGQIDRNMPFLQSYKLVGDELHSKGLLTVQNPSQAQAPVAQAPTPVPAAPVRQVLDTRPAAPKKQVANAYQARAATSGPRGTAKPTPREFDPFSMTDAEIMAITSPRI